MQNLILPAFVLALSGGSVSEPEALDYFSSETLALVELAGTESWLNRERLDRLVSAGESVGILDSEARSKVKQALMIGGLFVGQDPVDAAGMLTARGAALGWFGDENWGLVVCGKSAGLVDALRLKSFAALEASYDRRGGLDKRHGEHSGFDYWNLGDDLSLGVDGASLVVASDIGTLKSMLDTAAARPAGELIVDFPQADLRAWIDRGGIAKRLGESGKIGKVLGVLLETPRLPAVQFLLGPGMAKIGASRELTLGLTFGQRSVEVDLRGREPGMATGLEPVKQAHSRHLLRSSDLLSMVVYRDLEGIVGRRSELFEARDLPGFSKALGDLAILFGGLEIEADLLPGIGPWMEFCVGSFEFGDGPLPDLVLPGVALILEVDPKLESALVTAFQTAVGLANADLAQKGKAGFALGLELQDGVLVSSARLPAPAKGSAVDNRYNLVPAVAFVDGHFVFGSHAVIVGDVVRELKRGKPKQVTGEALHVNAEALGELLISSRSALVMNSVLEEGLAVETAEAKWDTLGSVVGLIEGLDFHVRYIDGGDVELGLELGLVRDWVEADR